MVKSEDVMILMIISLLIIVIPQSNSQSPPPPPPTSTGYSCSAARSLYPCRTYAFYRASPSPAPGQYPPFLDLPSIADLFLLPRLTVARSSNLTLNTTALSPGQPLLVPLTCSCANISAAPIPYTIAAGDTYYTVSSYKFGNLTSYPAVEAVNPSLVPTNLSIGDTVVFPIFCQCPGNNSNSTTTSSSSFLITYTFQPDDTFASLASEFGCDVQALISINGPEAKVAPYLTILIPVAKVPPPVILSYRPQLPAPSSSSDDDHGVVIGLAIGLGLMGLLWLVAGLGLVWFWRRGYFGKGRERSGEGEVAVEKGRFKGKLWRSVSDEKLMTDISEWLDKYKVYRVEELEEATAGFDRSRLIQGSVYRGVMDGEVYAIKKMKWNACDELKILQKVNHTNLVKLEGFCIEPEAGTCYLIYEFVENGSLSSWLHDPARSHALDWRSRLRIALDLAHGLQYIHEHTWPRVVHKDIKSSNVLLDSKMRAKIANFGLAKTGCNAVTTHIVGTQGYIAPEYLADGLVTTKLDVFAYGVVLVELVTGREAIGKEGEVLWMEVEGIFAKKDGRVEGIMMQWMDKAIVEDKSANMESVMNVMNIARACLQRDPGKRPSMVDVAYTLSKSDDMFSDFSEDGLAVGGSDVVGR